ncbi:hypothetical protein LOTGIDRAFT_158895 [Lottia gigantea]|uniref:Major facilitator superfamily (MFS) profile domain-containing protein n=1 Tax=Lottia gigantea TaxID=225164 RepID=V4AP25_LOTGI|nr:hypothetical protein LOTGIDRAFT_158895 [Lottia gigantea]ESO98937.1 hypothetical protein LOTGIDRAFT_158895 [Lottia gigantea]
MAPRKNSSSVSVNDTEVEIALTQSKAVKEEVEEDAKEKESIRNLPIDRGWAWVVAFACMGNTAILVGYLMCNGILFVEFLRIFKSSTTSTTLIFGFTSIIFSISSFIVMQIILPRFQIRQIICTGGILISLGVLASMFAQNITMLIASQAIFLGIGQSMIMGVNIVAVSRYFDKRRAFALAISNSGVSIAALVFPALCRLLLDTYGLKGTLLIFTGIELHLVVFGLLIRPLELPHEKLSPSSSASNLTVETESKDTAAELIPRQISCSSEKSSKPIKSRPRSVIAEKKNGYHHVASDFDQDLCESELRPRLLTMTSFVGSIASIPIALVEEKKSRPKSTILKDIVSIFKSLDFSIWKRPLFILILLTSTFGVPIYLYIIYLPAILAEYNGDPADVPIFLMIIGSVDFVSRLALGYFADLKYVKLRTIMMLAISIAGINCHLMRFYTSYTSQFVCVTIFGIVCNIYGTFIAVYVTDLLGIESLPKAMSFLQIIHGAFLSAYHPIIGILKDTTGTYVSSYHFLGTSALLAAFFLLLQPVFQKIDQKTIIKPEIQEEI